MAIASLTTAYSQLTAGDATAVTVQNRGPVPVYICGAAGAVAPTNDDNAIYLAPGDVITADITLAQLFPAIASVNRVYARTVRDTGSVMIAHA